MIKKTSALLLLSISFLVGQNIIKVKLKNGTTVDGEFVGTYMEHIHLLVDDTVNYFKCEDIQTVTESGYINVFEYDCSKNTVTADILFPPQINPMTGEWETAVPDLFNIKKREVLTKKGEKKLAKIEIHTSENEQTQKNSTYKPDFDTKKITKKQQKKTYQNKTEKKENGFKLSSKTGSKSISSLSENEIRRFIKNEVRKEIRKTLPYEIRKHKEKNRSKLLQNIFLGCGAWFLFMIMLS